MKSAWQTKKLGDILKLEYGKPLPKLKRKNDGAYPAYGANGEKDRTDQYYFNKRSIIVGRKGSAGEINLTEEKFWPLDVTYFVVFDDKEYDLYFLYYLLDILNIPKLAKGVKPGINRNDVYSLNVKVPEFLEQHRIVKILNVVFEKLIKAKAAGEKNLQNSKELFESYLHSVFENPENDWEICLLNDHVKFIDYRGRTPKKTLTGLRLITAKNIKMGYLKREPEEFINPKDYDGWMTRGIPKKGDILFTTEAPLGMVAQLDTDERVAFAQRTIIFQPDNNKLDQTFLKYLLMSPPVQKRIIEKGTGATVQGIKASLLKKIEIYFPKLLSEQKDLVKRLDNVSVETQKLEAIYKQKMADLEELEKSVLEKAFAGEL